MQRLDELAAAPARAMAAGSGEPHFVWSNGAADEPNCFALFRRVFVLADGPATATIRVFADTRYRLRVNGAIVGYGPARFYPSAPEQDDYDLTALLRPGRNCIAVEVHSRGESSYQAVPSRAGFLASGQVNGAAGEVVNLETPGAWEVRNPEAWHCETPTFSFALPSTEVLNVAALPARWFAGEEDDGWSAPARVAEAGWGELRACSAPPVRGDMIEPAQVAFAGPLRSEESRLIYHRRFQKPPGVAPRPWVCFAVWLHSPRAQEVALAGFWGEHFVNGEHVKMQRDPSRGNYYTCCARFRPGWNLLYGEVEWLAPSWGITLGWSRAAGLRATADPRGEKTGDLLVTAFMTRAERDEIRRPADQHDLAALNGLFQPVTLGLQNAFAARECAWDVAAGNAAMPSRAPEFPFPVPQSASGEGAVVLDFQREWIGHPAIQIECEAPCILDVANDEERRSDGLLRFYESHHLTNNADRFLLPAGRHSVESFHERGGRYLQLTVRSSGPVTIHRAGVRSALAEVPVRGRFESSDPLLNWIWETGVNTLTASMSDAWVDPWREQGCYLGDVYVEWLATRMFNPDLRLIQRCLRLWATGQREDGQMPAVAPAHYTHSHPDYTLTWVLLLRDYLRWSGDLATIEALWPTVTRIWNSTLWQSGADGLWNADGLGIFCDWGATATSIVGEANLLINCFRVGALDASAELARALGHAGAAEAFEEESAGVAGAIREKLWDAEAGAFAANSNREGRSAECPVHGNILALLFQIANPDQAPAVEQSVMARLRRDLSGATNPQKNGGHCDFYFLAFALEMLHQRVRHAEALEFIRGFWGMQRDRGAITFPETWPLHTEGVGSYCHGWACSPMISFMTQLAGIRATGDAIAITPVVPRDLEWFRAEFPHRCGTIEVEWERRGSETTMRARAPRGVVRRELSDSSLVLEEYEI